MVTLQSLAREILSQVSPITGGSIDTPANRDRVRRMAALEQPHLRDAFGLALHNMDLDVSGMLSRTRQVVTVVMWVFASVFALAVAMYYWPEAGALQESLQSARELLTLVPEEVQDVVVPLKRGLHVIASKQETGEQGLPGLSQRSGCMGWGCCHCC